MGRTWENTEVHGNYISPTRSPNMSPTIWKNMGNFGENYLEKHGKYEKS
jgi:hypothetical protein